MTASDDALTVGAYVLLVVTVLAFLLICAVVIVYALVSVVAYLFDGEPRGEAQEDEKTRFGKEDQR